MTYSGRLLISFCSINEINYILLFALYFSEDEEGMIYSSLLLISFCNINEINYNLLHVL